MATSHVGYAQPTQPSLSQSAASAGGAPVTSASAPRHVCCFLPGRRKSTLGISILGALNFMLKPPDFSGGGAAGCDGGGGPGGGGPSEPALAAMLLSLIHI